MTEKFAQKLFLSLLFLILSAGFSLAQESHTYESDEFSLELPTETWKALTREDTVRKNLEFVNGERSDGYLRIRKVVVEKDVDLSEFARTEADTKLRYLPGFVEGKEEKFAGRLNGVVANHEYTSAGRPMTGRLYYLRADDKTVYVLHFTGARDKLQRIQNQTDAIARSFKAKE